MPATTTLLGLVTPTQGTLSGTWGDTVNYGISDYVDIAVAGTLTLTNDGAVTLANTTGSSSGSSITSSLTGAGTVTAQFAIVKVTGTLTTAKVVTGPSYSKTYTVVNSATGGIVTFKASGQTGVSVAVGETAFVYFNGTDYVKIVGTATAGAAGGSNTQVQFNSSGILSGSSSLTWDGTTLSSTQVNITGQGTLRLQDTSGGEYVALRSPSALGASYTLTFPADDGTSGQALITDGSGVLSWSTAASGDVYGPGSSTDNAVARFDSTTGKLLQNSVVLIGDTGAVTGVTDLTASGSVTLSGGTANGVTYLNGSKVVTSGSALTFNGTNLGVGSSDYGNAGSINLSVGVVGTTSGGVQLWSNTTAAHSIQWGDGTTGSDTYRGAIEYSHNGDSMRFYTSATEQMRLTSTGLGIGTSSPAYKLDVQTSAGRFQVQNYGAGSVLLYSDGALAYNAATTGHQWQLNGTEQMRLDSSGNLGLGVTPSAWNSDYKAFNYGSAGLIYGRVGSKEVAFGTNWLRDSAASFVYAANGFASYYAQDSSNHTWYNAPSGTAGNAITFTQAMTLDADGDLGIGTTSPRVRLQVTPSSNAGEPSLGTANAGSVFTNSSGLYGLNLGVAPSGYTWMQAMRFDGTATAYDMVLQAAGGNVGIGTSSIPSKLDVVGANKTNANEYGTITAWSSDSYAADKGGSLAFWGKYNSSSGNACFGRIYGAKQDATDGSFLGYLGFSTSPGGTPVERMRLTSAGNLGVGNFTPYNTWGNSYVAIQVANGARSLAATGAGSGDLTLVFNAVYDSTDSRWEYAGTGDAAVRYSQTGAGIHAWYNAPVGTVGNAVTFTQAMTLDADGDLGIGTTAPTAKLHVLTGDTYAATFNTTVTSASSTRISFGALGSAAGGSGGSVAIGGNTTHSATAQSSMTFYTHDGTNLVERARFNPTGAFVFNGGTTTADGIGITFPATQSASTDANCLDDYEEGTWTPTLSTNGFSGTPALSSGTGVYTKIGRVVTVRAILAFGSFTYPSGYVLIAGLPFTTAAGGFVGAFTGAHPGSGPMGGACAAFSNSIDAAPTAATTTSTQWTYTITYFV